MGRVTCRDAEISTGRARAMQHAPCAISPSKSWAQSNLGALETAVYRLLAQIARPSALQFIRPSNSTVPQASKSVK
eukprot:145573-Chlamydomonas_euryale.AAC.19